MHFKLNYSKLVLVLLIMLSVMFDMTYSLDTTHELLIQEKIGHGIFWGTSTFSSILFLSNSIFADNVVIKIELRRLYIYLFSLALGIIAGSSFIHYFSDYDSLIDKERNWVLVKVTITYLLLLLFFIVTNIIAFSNPKPSKAD